MRPIDWLASALFAMAGPAPAAAKEAAPVISQVISREDARHDTSEWGNIQAYFEGNSEGTTDRLAATITLRPGHEVHPPHKHVEEEYLMIVNGAGTWSLNGKEFAAKAGDMLYAKAWDMHGLKNGNASDLQFVVVKFNPEQSIEKEGRK